MPAATPDTPAIAQPPERETTPADFGGMEETALNPDAAPQRAKEKTAKEKPKAKKKGKYSDVPGYDKYKGKVWMIDGKRWNAAQIAKTAQKHNKSMDHILHSLRYAKKKQGN